MSPWIISDDLIMKKQFIVIMMTCFTTVSAQEKNVAGSLTLSGYLETYYSYNFNQPAKHVRPAFIYSFNRHNEVNLNLGMIKTAYNMEKIRGSLALMTGTYSNANLAGEPGVLKNIYEASVGVKISNTKNVWIDAGIFPAHIGFESAVGKDCWTLTRSMSADNSPYFESGVKIAYTSTNDKWFLSALVLNGWQRIQRIDGNNTLGFGHQLIFRPGKNIQLNSSSFIGNDQPDSIKLIRCFHDFYGQFQFTPKVGLILCFDIGVQQKAKGSSGYNCWYTPVVIVRYTPYKKVNLAARAEYYDDPEQVSINIGAGFRTFGYSVNADYHIAPNVIWRIEARTFNSKKNIFETAKEGTASNSYCITSSMAIAF